ncbi:MFS transporter [Achromobacter denitrificans]|uniref:MFS transporter n=1 Tax=Achromobacter denitrificans TaxID=32002 RepID=A0ABZ3FWE4_ACHDE|nr:MFS transporter [Achromobacter xylosoxidans]
MHEHMADTRQRDDAPEDANTRETYARVTRRLFPFFLVCFTLAFLDRVNIGFAQLQMQRDLAFSSAIYGLGAGVFFIGYVLLEVPSNLLLRKYGARKTLTRIMVLWGLISTAMMFVRTPMEFYVLRLLLGMAEAGFFPGMVLYFTYWYPRRRRAAIINVATLGSCVAGAGGGIVSGALIHFTDGVGGLAGWQWMFLAEGAPSVVMGVVAWFYLVDRPGAARWLSESQKSIIVADLRSEDEPAAAHSGAELARLLRRPGVYVLSIVYFCLNAGIYTLGFWIPSIVRGFGIADPLTIGLYSAIPYAFGAVAMTFMTRSSDRLQERRWHFAIAMTLGALALVLLTLTTRNFFVSMALVTVAFPLIFGSLPIFWAACSGWLGESMQASGLAFISSLGAIGAFVSPALLGWIKTETGSLNNGFYLIAIVMVIASGMMVAMIAPRTASPLRRPVSQRA